MQRKRNKNRPWRPSLEILESRRLLASLWADFNGDGFDDLAVAAPGEDFGSVDNAGAVHVIFGSAGGLTSTGNQLWTQDSIDILDTAETDDGFGTALAGGDFNADGFADLAIGIPGEDIGSLVDAGAIHVLYGDLTGFKGKDEFLHEDTNRVRDIAEAGDLFGSSVASGDFNKDGFSDLAVGVPGQDVGGTVDAGGIHIFYGGGAGLKPPGNQTFNMDSPAMVGTASAGDAFGATLSSGDFNGDGGSDLAVAAPLADVGTADDSGVIVVIFASPNGLSPVGSDIESTAFPGAENGSALTSGDFNGDGFDDVAAGAPFALAAGGGGVTGAGLVRIYEGSAGGTSLKVFFSQSNLGGSNTSEVDDTWGSSLVAADFDKDGFDDLAIAAPMEDVAGVVDAGTVNLMYGTGAGLSVANNVTFVQEDLKNGESETDDHLGKALSAGDFDGNGLADLVIGVPDEDVGEFVDAGNVYVVIDASSSSDSAYWDQDTDTILDELDKADAFGGGLDSGAGRSSAGGSERQDIAHLVTADPELDSSLTKSRKRRSPSSRR